MIKPWLHLVPGGYILYKAYLKEEDILITSLQRKGNGISEHQNTATQEQDSLRILTITELEDMFEVKADSEIGRY